MTSRQMMSPDEVRRIVEEALPETSARNLEARLVLKEEPSTWIIMLGKDEQEWVVRVEETGDSTPESLRGDVIEQVRRLF